MLVDGVFFSPSPQTMKSLYYVLHFASPKEVFFFSNISSHTPIIFNVKFGFFFFYKRSSHILKNAYHWKYEATVIRLTQLSLVKHYEQLDVHERTFCSCYWDLDIFKWRDAAIVKGKQRSLIQPSVIQFYEATFNITAFFPQFSVCISQLSCKLVAGKKNRQSCSIKGRRFCLDKKKKTTTLQQSGTGLIWWKIFLLILCFSPQ